jgi:hypothetical protein
MPGCSFGGQARAIDDAREGNRRSGRVFQTKQRTDGRSEAAKILAVLGTIPNGFDIA